MWFFTILPDPTGAEGVPRNSETMELCLSTPLSRPCTPTHGDIVVNLFGDHAPRTVKNFVGLADGTGEWKNPATGKPGVGPALPGRRSSTASSPAS